MKYLHRLVMAALGAAFFMASAQAQNAGTVSNHAVPVGKGPGVSGYTSVAPGATGIPLTSNGASADPSFHPATNAGIAPGAANTVKGSVNGTTTSDLAITSCSAIYQFTQWVSGTGWQCGIIPVLPSRAVAATLNLSAFSSIMTLDYSVAGDGGGASFVKIAAGTPFLDTYIDNNNTPPTRVGGSGYVNGTYLGVPLGNGSGLGCSGKVTVSGGAVTAVSLAVPCAGYKVGDVLTALNSFLGGSGSGFTWTVNAISTPQASFTDSAGNLWQYVARGLPNALQFGCKGDWNGTDAGATDNGPCLWSAASWASYPIGTSSAQVNGNRIYVPRGAYKVCGTWNGTIYTVPLPQGVVFSGPGVGGATLLECAANSSASHFIELCDSNSAVGQYGCKVENMTISSAQIVSSSGGVASVYSTSGQQFPLGENLEIQSGLKGCIKYDVGLGGAANDTWLGIDCEQLQGATNPGYLFNASTTQHILKYSTYGCNGTGCTLAIQVLNGRLVADGLDIENVATGLQHNVTTSNNNGVYKNVQQNSNHCTQAIQLIIGNLAGNLIMENVSTGCPTGITNGQAGGANYASGVIRGALMCVGNPCAAAVP
jgi:hypothetical protein